MANGGGQLGNQNASKGLNSSNRASYMRNYRKEHAGHIPYRLVGRPRKIVAKGDIFDVAAKLARALAHPLELSGAEALKAYYAYWENE